VEEHILVGVVCKLVLVGEHMLVLVEEYMLVLVVVYRIFLVEEHILLVVVVLVDNPLVPLVVYMRGVLVLHTLV